MPLRSHQRGFFMCAMKVGEKYAKLTVVRLFTGIRESGTTSHKAECLCECGVTGEYERANLTSGNTKHCAKCALSRKSETHKTHGHTSQKEKGGLKDKCYYTWKSMKARCSNPNTERFSYYGGRGINVCSRWVDSYEAFLDDMGLPPGMDSQIDRTNNESGYSKENCKWVTRTKNANNKRSNQQITAFGKTMNLCEWARETGIKRETIAMRLRRGYDPESALHSGGRNISKKKYHTPFGVFASLPQCSESTGMSVSGAFSRFKSESFADWFIVIK